MDDFLKVMAAFTPVVLGVLTYLTERARRESVEARKAAAASADRVAAVVSTNAKATTRAVEQVRTTLAETTGSSSEKLDTIHTLVNSRLTEALAKIDALEAKLQDLTGERPTGEPPAAPRR